MSERTTKEEAKAELKKRKDTTDVIITALAAVITDIKPSTPAVEYALVRLTETQTWVESAIKGAYVARLKGDQPGETTPPAMRDIIGGYHYASEWDSEDSVFTARVAEFPNLGARAATAKGAIVELSRVVADCIVDLLGSKEPVPQPMTEDQFAAFLNEQGEPDAD